MNDKSCKIKSLVEPGKLQKLQSNLFSMVTLEEWLTDCLLQVDNLIQVHGIRVDIYVVVNFFFFLGGWGDSLPSSETKENTNLTALKISNHNKN